MVKPRAFNRFKRLPSPESIGQVWRRWRIHRKKKILYVSVAKQGRKDRFSSVIVPGTGRIVYAALSAIVPGEITQNDFLRGCASNFRGFDRSWISRLWPGPISCPTHMTHTERIEPKRHIVADTIGIPTGLDLGKLRVSFVRGTSENAESIGHIPVQRPICCIHITSHGSDNRISRVPWF